MYTNILAYAEKSSPIRWDFHSFGFGFIQVNLHLTRSNQECIPCYCVQHDKTILRYGQKFFVRVSNCKLE